MIHALTHNEKESEKKIKALNEIHSQKIKALLRSIQNLKKDVQKEKHAKKDNVRAQMIERLKKDIGDNEVVIETLRKLIGDDDVIEKELMKVINKGPPRMRVMTREELRMEIKKLKNKLARKSKKKDDAEEDDQSAKSEKGQDNADLEKENVSDFENASMYGMNDAEEAKRRLEETVNVLQNELKDKNDVILTLREDIENLKVEVRARDMNINRQQKSITELHEEVRDLKSLEVELRQTLHKKRALEEENQEYKGKLFDRFVDNQKDEIESKEKDIESRGMLAKLKSIQEQVETLKKEKETKQEEFNHALSIQRAELKKERREHQSTSEAYESLKETAESLESQLKQQDIEIDSLQHNQGQELKKIKDGAKAATEKLEEQQAEVEKLLKEKDELERQLDIKQNEIEFYKGELDRAGIESDFEESMGSQGNTDRENYHDLYFKEKEKVRNLIQEQRRLLDLIETLKLQLEQRQKSAVLRAGSRERQ